MKKHTLLILSAILFSMTANICIADEMDYSPNWSNIAPAGYSDNIQYVEDNTFFKKHRILSGLTAATIVGLPVSIVSRNRSEKIENNNYWYSRKNEFDEQLNFCKQMESKDNKMACFNNLIQSEHSKTAQRQQLQLQQQANIINANNGIRMQNAINNLNNSINRPRTYMQTGNFIYSY